jgi:LPS export ABC transporter protein LptC
MRWQKRARLGIAIFGIAFAAVVYSAIGERVTPSPAPTPIRLDPTAVVESSKCVLYRETGAKQDFTVTCERQLAWENGATKLMGVRIDVKEREGRDFIITSGEATAGAKQQDLQLSGDVKMAASDGFVLSTALATFNQVEGVVRSSGPVSFSKGMMTGSGNGMTYDKNTDVLVILDAARVRMSDKGGNTTGEFAAGKATLSRQENYLLLETAVHVLRGEQTLDAERVRASLTDDDERITFIELRDKAEVVGGSGGFDSMSADAIDLDYADDGETIERVLLNQSAVVALKGQQGGPGRQMVGESLTLTLAPDGAVTSATGREQVQMDLPASGGEAGRRITARNLDAAGEAGKGMTSVRFTENVEYREEAAQDGAPRVARSHELTVDLDGDAVSGALFTGRAQFEERGLKASAAEARYQPTAGVLRLTGADEGGGPRVADEQISIEADAIDVTLEGRKMTAAGNVKTLLQGQSTTPGLLAEGQPTNVSAATLRYEGDPGRALYTGGAQLWQGDTAIRGDTITIDRENGNLSAAGNARSTLVFGEDTSIGRGEEIRYEDAARQITYVGARPPPDTVAPKGKGKVAPASEAAAAPAGEVKGAPAGEVEVAPLYRPAQLSGPQGDLTAYRIVVQLGKSERTMERLEAFDDITLRLDTRVATGSRLTYFTADERYVLSGTAAIPVKVVEACRDTSGQTLTFFKTADRIIVDGNEERRTQTKTGGGPCPEPRSR